MGPYTFNHLLKHIIKSKFLLKKKQITFSLKYAGDVSLDILDEGNCLLAPNLLEVLALLVLCLLPSWSVVFVSAPDDFLLTSEPTLVSLLKKEKALTPKRIYCIKFKRFEVTLNSKTFRNPPEIGFFSSSILKVQRKTKRRQTENLHAKGFYKYFFFVKLILIFIFY